MRPLAFEAEDPGREPGGESLPPKAGQVRDLGSLYDGRMEIRLGAHGADHHQYHLVWIPKYRKRVLTGARKDLLAK